MEKESDDDMGNSIRVESPETHNHYPAPIKESGLAKALIGAGLLATGIGIPAGAWFVADALKSKPAPVVAPVEQPSEVETKTETKIIDWSVGQPIVE